MTFLCTCLTAEKQDATDLPREVEVHEKDDLLNLVSRPVVKPKYYEKDLAKGANRQAPNAQMPDSTGNKLSESTPGLPLPEDPESLSEAIKSLHGAIRWEKPWNDIVASVNGIDMKALCNVEDPVNGNFALHIAAQNGHLEIVRQLIDLGVDVNVKNRKGNSPLHMSVQYDLYFVSKLLIDSGANQDLENDAGMKASVGIDGNKVDKEAWDNPLTMLSSASNEEQFNIAFEALENAPKGSITKERLILIGTSKKKAEETKDCWQHQRFLSLARNV
jgi:hypothetical protein